MKKNFIKGIFIISFIVISSIFSFSFNIQHSNVEITAKNANAICRTYYGGASVCCFNGNSGCTNAVNNEHRGPYYYAMQQ